jgi:hypothetical protein
VPVAAAAVRLEKGPAKGLFFCRRAASQAAPIEIDANAAAARFAWTRHGEAVERLLEHGAGQHEPLFRYRGGPGPLETLPARTIRFALLFAERCERRAAVEGLTFAEVLEARWPGAGAFWAELGPASL